MIFFVELLYLYVYNSIVIYYFTHSFFQKRIRIPSVLIFGLLLIIDFFFSNYLTDVLSINDFIGKFFSLIFTFLFIFIFYNVNLKSCGVGMVFCFLLIVACESAAFIFAHLFMEDRIDHLPRILYNIILFMARVINLVIIWCFSNKKNHKSDMNPHYKNYKTEIWTSVAGMLFIIWMLVLIYISPNSFHHNIDCIFSIFSIITFTIVFLAITIINKILSQSEMLIQEKLKSRLLEMELELNQDLTLVTKNLKALRHDMNNHIGVIQGLVHTKQYDKLEEYADTTFSDLKYANNVVVLGNVSLSLLINNKIGVIQAEGIKFNSIIMVNDISIPDKELNIIFGNMLDNAIEAVRQCKADKFIHLTIDKKNNEYSFICENSYKIEPNYSNGYFITSKKDQKIHGIGIQNMMESVNKLHGMIYIEFESGIFSVNIKVPEQLEGCIWNI